MKFEDKRQLITIEEFKKSFVKNVIGQNVMSVIYQGLKQLNIALIHK